MSCAGSDGDSLITGTMGVSREGLLHAKTLSEGTASLIRCLLEFPSQILSESSLTAAERGSRILLYRKKLGYEG